MPLANLSGVDLSNANLHRAALSGANLTGAKLPNFQLPEGDLTVYKKCREGRIVTLKIPAGARRTAILVGNKCRAEQAIVVDIKDRLRPNSDPTVAYSFHDADFEYAIGETVSVDNFNDDIRIECAPGIHFFESHTEALLYDY